MVHLHLPLERREIIFENIPINETQAPSERGAFFI
jgi:hypothetical protein